MLNRYDAGLERIWVRGQQVCVLGMWGGLHILHQQRSRSRGQRGKSQFVCGHRVKQHGIHLLRHHFHPEIGKLFLFYMSHFKRFEYFFLPT